MMSMTEMGTRTPTLSGEKELNNAAGQLGSTAGRSNSYSDIPRISLSSVHTRWEGNPYDQRLHSSLILVSMQERAVFPPS